MFCKYYNQSIDVVDDVVASWGITFIEPGKNMGSMQHIDIIERTEQTKKNNYAKSKNHVMQLPQEFVGSLLRP
jgi:hypothetical protein